MESWLIAVIVLLAIACTLYCIKVALQLWARKQYRIIKQSEPTSHCDIDTFVTNTKQNNPVNAVKCVVSHYIQIGSSSAQKKKKLSLNKPIPLEFVPSPHVPGLYVSRRKGSVGVGVASTSSTSTSTSTSNTTVVELSDLMKNDTAKPIVVCTIRMGFGHHRLAYSVSSWALQQQNQQQQNRPTIFHDLLNIDSPESDLIKSTDALYSKFSRIASEWGGPIEKLWGTMMLQGDANALRIAANVAKHIQPLLTYYPKDICIITTHQLCALVASAAGFTNVVNLVVDNWPQWFLTVPNTLNIVQGPVNYQCFLQFGIHPKELQWAGHWCPYDLVQNINLDCTRRIQRLLQQQQQQGNTKNKKAAAAPIRLLIPVGGAGAQRTFIIEFVRLLAPYVQSGKVQLLLNAGDHEHMKTAFLQILDECSISFDMIHTTEGVRNFQQRLLVNDGTTNEPNHGVTLFAFDEYFPAVATTDLLCRVADVLCCKPSELAFYCIPKLHIRRVGDHEAASAKRASELGDGSLEARELDDAKSYLDLFLSSPDLLLSMNYAIMNNHKIGIYDGCKKAVELSLERSSSSSSTLVSRKDDQKTESTTSSSR